MPRRGGTVFAGTGRRLKPSYKQGFEVAAPCSLPSGLSNSYRVNFTFSLGNNCNEQVITDQVICTRNGVIWRFDNDTCYPNEISQGTNAPNYAKGLTVVVNLDGSGNPDCAWRVLVKTNINDKADCTGSSLGPVSRTARKNTGNDPTGDATKWSGGDDCDDGSEFSAKLTNVSVAEVA